MKLHTNREKYLTDATTTDQILKQYLKRHNIDTIDLWNIKYNETTGRGIYATEDIPLNTTIFVDYPLILGTRYSSNCKPLCTVCFKEDVQLIQCAKKCGLPLCSNECANTTVHTNDCNVVREWLEKSSHESFAVWSLNLLRALTAIRGMELSPTDVEVLSLLQGNQSAQQGAEIKLLKLLELKIPKEDEEFLLSTCQILDTNAFESIYESNTKVSLRGLYPVSALLNHNCSPNTTHLFDKEGRMIVKNTRFIRAGEEITITYTNLLWGTVTRRHNLYMTKQFWCHCNRCMDLKEFGYPLSALYCTDINKCDGLMLPKVISNDISVPWVCTSCGKKSSSKQIGIFQSTLSAVVNPYYSDTVENLIEFLQNRIDLSIPNCNQLIVDLKLRVVGILGHRSGYLFNELSDHLLEYKEKLCREIINIVEVLQLGENKMKGFLLQELYLTLMEKSQRRNEKNTKEVTYVKVAAIKILRGDCRLMIKD
ncbi:SET domain-containing protein SmydA-8-like [Chrysoperla carnea]|uniref:SET domain-containing protein SmydA-8-like n=1 Tax=Chrysoperla carnea TaxID=189513 RepID=UPI001D062651|nr:SET domain-containing protein SmydA-8-like [Chrysoperla carnea]